MYFQSTETLLDSSFGNVVELGEIEVISSCLDLSMVLNISDLKVLFMYVDCAVHLDSEDTLPWN